VVNPTEVITKTDFHPYSLSFFDESLEKKFMTYRIKQRLNQIRFYYFVTLILYCIYLLSGYFYNDYVEEDEMNIFYSKISISGFLLLNGIIVLTDYYEEYYIKITLFVIISRFYLNHFFSMYSMFASQRLF